MGVVGLVGAESARGSAFYSVKDLGSYSQADATGSLLLGVDGRGQVTSSPNYGSQFGTSGNAGWPIPAGDTAYYRVAKGSDNGVYTAGTAWNPAANRFDGYTVNGGVVTVLSPLDASQPGSAIRPFAVNNSGQVAGMASYADGSGGVISGPAVSSPGGGSQMLATTGGSAYAINNLGQVVGAFIPDLKAGAGTHAFLWVGDSRTLYDLNTLIPAGSGWTLTTATGLNDQGQIVSYATDAAGAHHAVLLSPLDPKNPVPSGDPQTTPPSQVPEPSTLTFGAVVLLGLAARKAWAARRVAGVGCRGLSSTRAGWPRNTG